MYVQHEKFHEHISDTKELPGQVIGAIKEEIEDVYNLPWEMQVEQV